MTNANHHGENDDSLEPVEEREEQSVQENRSAMEKRFSVTGFPSPPPDRVNKPGVKKITQLEWLMPDYDKQEVPEPVKEIANLAEEIETAAGVQRKQQEAAALEPAPPNPLNEPYPKRATQASNHFEQAAQEIKQRPEEARHSQEVRQSPQAYLQDGSQQDSQSRQNFDNLDATRVPPLPRSLSTPADLENTRPSKDNAQAQKEQAQESTPTYSKEALAAIPTPRATTETKRPITETKRPLSEEPSEPATRKSRLPRSFTKDQKYSQGEEEEEAETKGARRTRSLSRSIERPSALGGIFESRRGKIAAILVGSIALGFAIGLTAFLAMPRGDKDKDRDFARDNNTADATTTRNRNSAQNKTPSLPFLKLDTSYKTIEEAEAGFDEAVSKGELSDAQKALDQAHKLAPESLNAQEKQGLLHHLKGDSQSALQVLNDVLQKSPRHLPALFDRALIYFAQGKFKKAQLDYTLINAIEPGNENALLGLALCKLKTGETEAGLSTLSKITAENPGNTLAHRAAGEEFLKDGDYERSVSAFSRALDTTSPDAEILALRARAYLLGGNKEKAVADYAEAISLKSKPEWKADLEIAKGQP